MRFTCKVEEREEDIVSTEEGDAGGERVVKGGNVFSDDGMGPALEVCYLRKISKQLVDYLISKVA